MSDLCHSTTLLFQHSPKGGTLSSTTITNQPKKPSTSFTVDFLLSKSPSDLTVANDTTPFIPKFDHSHENVFALPRSGAFATSFDLNQFVGLNRWLPIAFSADMRLKPRPPGVCYPIGVSSSIDVPAASMDEYRSHLSNGLSREMIDSTVTSSIPRNTHDEHIQTLRCSTQSQRQFLPLFNKVPFSLRPSSAADIDIYPCSPSGLRKWPFQRQTDAKLSTESPDVTTLLWSPSSVANSNRCTNGA